MPNKFNSVTPSGPTQTETDVWITPKWIIDKIGPFDLDPCAWRPENPIVKIAGKCYTEQDDGLSKEWTENFTFVNPPYSALFDWLEKCRQQYEKHGKNIIALTFARTETKAFQRNLVNCSGINLMNRRVSFLTGDGIVRGNGNAPSVLIAWGEEALQRICNVDGLVFQKIQRNVNTAS